MPKQLVPRTRGHGTLTEAQFKQKIIGLLRKGTRFWKPATARKMQIRHHTRLVNPKTGKLCYHSKCEGCHQLVPEGTIKMDHTEPVVDPEEGFIDFDRWIERAFVEIDGFQGLCETCHKTKTDEENEQRRVWKKRRKDGN